MAKHLLHLKSNQLVEGKAKLPTPESIEYGEIAINYAAGNETISLKNANNEIVTFSSNSQQDGKYMAKGHTVNAKEIETDPVLNGADIKIDGYTVDTGLNEQLVIVETDTVNQALGKLEKHVNDNEEVTSKAMNVLNNSCGFNENGIYEPSHEIIAQSTSVSEALEALAKKITDVETGDTGVSINVVQETGQSTTDVMSQKAVTDAIETAVSNISSITVEQTTGQSTESVMSQKAVTDELAKRDSYTVNAKAINTNPVLNGSDIKLDGYTIDSGTNEALAIATGDTVNQAFGKLEKHVYDNEEVTSKAINELNNSCGFDENCKVKFLSPYISAFQNVSDAMDYLANDLLYYSGHNSVTSLNSVPLNKRLVIATLSNNDTLSLGGLGISDGRELEIIVHNTSSNDITISMPNSGGFVNQSGEVLTVKGNTYADINILSDGTNFYIRFL